MTTTDPWAVDWREDGPNALLSPTASAPRAALRPVGSDARDGE